jgi:hypothetical protein
MQVLGHICPTWHQVPDTPSLPREGGGKRGRPAPLPTPPLSRSFSVYDALSTPPSLSISLSLSLGVVHVCTMSVVISPLPRRRQHSLSLQQAVHHGAQKQGIMTVCQPRKIGPAGVWGRPGSSWPGPMAETSRVWGTDARRSRTSSQ